MNSDIQTHTSRIEQRVNAPVDRVFNACIQPRDLEVWSWGAMGTDVRAEVDARVGGRIVVSTLCPDGKRWSFFGIITSLVPNAVVAHTLAWDAPMGYDNAEETLRFELASEDSHTNVVLEHTGTFDTAARDEHNRGWRDVLNALKNHVEQTTATS